MSRFVRKRCVASSSTDDDIGERDALADVPNALSYHRVLETTTNGYLVRQYMYSSLYDRMRYSRSNVVMRIL